MKPIGSVVRVLVVAFAAGLLGACGGAESDPSPPAVLSLVVSPMTVNLQGLTNQSGSGAATVTLSLLNMGVSDSVYMGGSYSNAGIQAIILATNRTQGTANITFRKASELAVGTYHDTITLRACLESPCVNHIAGSPVTVSVDYTVAAAGPPTMILQSNSVAATAFLLDPAPSTTGVNVSFPNLRPTDSFPYVFSSSTGTAVTNASFSQGTAVTGLAGRIAINLKTPSTVDTGIHADTLTVWACLEVQCTHELAGSPVDISVQYTVSNVFMGTGYRARALKLIANDLVWDNFRNVLYVSIPGSSPTNPNAIGVLDPVTATFTRYVPVGSNPDRLEISPDGQYLFVALQGASEIKRLALPSLALDLTIPVGVEDNTGSALYAGEMHVSPDSPHVLGVVRGHGQSAPKDIAVFDDAVMRPLVAGGIFSRFSTFQWDSASRIFAVDSLTSSRATAQIGVGPTGTQVTASQQVVYPMSLNGGEAYLWNGRMYTAVGVFYDPLTFTSLGQMPVSMGTGMGMTLDPVQGKVFYATPWEIVAYNANTFAQIATIPALPNATPLVRKTRLIRWGYDGLALMNYQAFSPNPFPGIVLIDGPFVRP